jgi:hypothetical protein
VLITRRQNSNPSLTLTSGIHLSQLGVHLVSLTPTDKVVYRDVFRRHHQPPLAILFRLLANHRSLCPSNAVSMSTPHRQARRPFHLGPYAVGCHQLYLLLCPCALGSLVAWENAVGAHLCKQRSGLA